MRRSDRAPHDRLRSKRGGKGRPSPGVGHRPAAAPARPRAAEPVEDDRPGAIRLQKLLSLAGVASRRTAEILITEGRVTVNGEVVSTLGAKAVPDVDDVKVDGRRIRPASARPLHPAQQAARLRDDPARSRGPAHGARPARRRPASTSIRSAASTTTAEGLLLLTSDGDLAARLTHPRHEVPRVYEAIVAGAPDDDAVQELRRGVYLDGRRTAEADITRGHTIGKGREQTTKLVLTLYEGRNRQVREMCARIGHPVRTLQRVALGPLSLRGLPVGAWRDLTPAEIAALRDY